MLVNCQNAFKILGIKKLCSCKTMAIFVLQSQFIFVDRQPFCHYIKFLRAVVTAAVVPVVGVVPSVVSSPLVGPAGVVVPGVDVVTFAVDPGTVVPTLVVAVVEIVSFIVSHVKQHH